MQDHMLVLHMVIQNALLMRDFMLTHHGVWEQVAKDCKL